MLGSSIVVNVCTFIRMHRVFVSAPALGRAAVIALVLALFPGCQRSVDMSAQDPKWIATTISYSGVRDANRLFPDYSIIDARILNTAAAQGGSSKPGRKGAVR